MKDGLYANATSRRHAHPFATLGKACALWRCTGEKNFFMQFQIGSLTVSQMTTYKYFPPSLKN